MSHRPHLELEGQPRHESLPLASPQPAQRPSTPNAGGETRSDLGVFSADDDPGGIRATLTELWQELLSEFQPGYSIDALGPDVDLFAAGGTSVLAVMLLSRVQEELGVDVSFRALLEEPTIRGLSRRIIEFVLAEPVPGFHTHSNE